MRAAPVAFLSFLALALPPLAASGPTSRVPKPAVVWKPIPFGAKRHAETVAYARRHYGLDRWRIVGPHVIVEHMSLAASFSSVYSTFAPDVRDAELHELPGLCAHFVVDRDGAIYQLVSLNTICRHTVGLNWTAIGIEHVGRSDADVLGDPRQFDASVRLTLWLEQRFHIPLRDVIGHNESVTSPYHRERVGALRCQTHADWRPADMLVYRRKLAALARRYGVAIGPPPARSRPPGC
jgi:beta-N-acetylhexosaminidase